jgi:CHAT domain-containing protein/tetratricopeptide (TPR) repeat protein
MINGRTRLRAKTKELFPRLWTSTRRYLCALLLLLLIPLQELRPHCVQMTYDRAFQHFRQGYLERSAQEAELGFLQYRTSSPAWAVKFLLLEARSYSWQGKVAEVRRVLESYPIPDYGDAGVQKMYFRVKLSMDAQNVALASQQVVLADKLCAQADFPSCGDVLVLHGAVADAEGQRSAAKQYFLDALAFARKHHDSWLVSIALDDIGWSALEDNHYDFAVDWLKMALQTAEEQQARVQSENILGNLGAAYSQLGDTERALEINQKVEKLAEESGDSRLRVRTLENVGALYQKLGQTEYAATALSYALDLARQLNSRQDILYALQDLAYAALEAGNIRQGSAWINEINHLIPSRENGREDHRNALLLVQLQGMLAAATHQYRQAEADYLAIEKDSSAPTFMRLDAGDRLAGLLETEGRSRAAEKVYINNLAVYESARNKLRGEDHLLPFLTNALALYDDYIHLLVQQKRQSEALKIASQSRAQTLEHGLFPTRNISPLVSAKVHPGQFAQKDGATLLFYWLGQKQSYLWAITPRKTAFFVLPSQLKITSYVARYRSEILAMQDPVRAGAESPSYRDGRALYSMLVAPAVPLIDLRHPVMILADGALNQLNFGTLLAPGPVAGSVSGANDASNPAASTTAHYWIEDVTVLSASSFSMLGGSKPDKSPKNLLLVGNAVSSGRDYPELPMAGMEMKLIENHFAPSQQMVLSRTQATPAAYLSNSPEKYSYIHFVAHGTASTADPLDSAIILSSANSPEKSYKLYAYKILQHPIHARLVTISSCTGNGTRIYAGEGLVGLSWAFLRAGAHNVIGALWEVSDNATPRLMDRLYQELETGEPPSVALRAAQLSLLHSSGNFRAPFFWATFQLYTGH